MIEIYNLPYYNQLEQEHEQLMTLARTDLSKLGDTHSDPWKMKYEELVQTYAPRVALGLVHHPREVTRLMDIHYALVQLEDIVININQDNGNGDKQDELDRALLPLRQLIRTDKGYEEYNGN